MGKLTDPNFREGVVRSMSSSAKNANEWGRAQLGVDVGGFVAEVASKSTSYAKGSYAAVNPHGDQFEDEHTTSALYADAGEDDFFKQLDNRASKNMGTSSTPISSTTAKSTAVNASQTERQTDEWGGDEWKDF